MQHTEKGFTLIEILTVLIIIGIMIGFSLLAFGDFGASRKALVNAEQLSAYVKLLQQQALFENRALGIQINSKGYSTYQFVSGSWQNMPAKSIFHEHLFPSNIVVKMKAKANNKEPDILIDSSGNLNHFALDFGTVKKSGLATLISLADGQLLISNHD